MAQKVFRTKIKHATHTHAHAHAHRKPQETGDMRLSIEGDGISCHISYYTEAIALLDCVVSSVYHHHLCGCECRPD